MRTEFEAYWKRYYTDLCRSAGGQPQPFLDLSNERVHAQTVSLVLEAAGSLHGARCLDVGCGSGVLTLCVQAMGGGAVGVDIVEEMILRLRELHPGVSWVTGSYLDPWLLKPDDAFDVVFAVEALQYAPSIEEALDILWRHVNSKGRLMGVVPNARCPTVQKVMGRFDGKYHAVTERELADAVVKLPSVGAWAMRGMIFREDQRLWPYEVTPWVTICDHWTVVPNRLLFVLEKASN